MEKATLFGGLRAYREKSGRLLSDFRLLKGFPEIKLCNFGSEDDRWLDSSSPATPAHQSDGIFF